MREDKFVLLLELPDITVESVLVSSDELKAVVVYVKIVPVALVLLLLEVAFPSKSKGMLILQLVRTSEGVTIHEKQDMYFKANYTYVVLLTTYRRQHV